jgi:hypothetical protein
MMELEALGWAKSVNSNHQYKLCRHMSGEKVNIRCGLENTVRELSTLSKQEFNEIHQWLLSLPLWYEFTDSGVEYVAVHAFWSSHMGELSKASKKTKKLCLYGPTTKEDVRISWWDEPEYKEGLTKFVVAGHYHKVRVMGHCAVIDGGAGSGGPLIAYIPSTGELVKVSYGS